jgi:glycosyltransferase involved in cell wall biosynthesis
VLFGEIKPYKGLDLLIEAVAKMPPAVRVQCRVVVAGRPRMDMAPLLDLIASRQVEAQFDIRPERQTEEQRAVLFDQADCFVFPYRQIDASGVYFLVKSLGKWLVASKVGIFAEDIEVGVDGVLVACDDAAALSTELQSAIVNRPRRDPASTLNSWSEIGRSTRALYHQATAEFGKVVGKQDQAIVGE